MSKCDRAKKIEGATEGEALTVSVPNAAAVVVVFIVETFEEAGSGREFGDQSGSELECGGAVVVLGVVVRDDGAAEVGEGKLGARVE